MNLRNVTRWTILPLLIVAVVAPIWGVAFFLLLGNDKVNMAVPAILVFWLVTALPLFISYGIALHLKYSVPLTTLLVSTIACGISYALMVCMAVYTDGRHCFLFFVAPLPIMIITWIIALLLDSYFEKKTPHPVLIRGLRGVPLRPRLK